MRTTFIDTLCALAEQDERIWLLTGDLGFSVLERFFERFPKRFINVGVAEQNMTGIAAGLALSGNIVFTYSIANFPIVRCLEQIRNDVCYHNLNVKIVAVGGGMAYGSAGYTHHAIEDLALMSILPNMTVIAPSDSVETRLAVSAIVKHDGPCYLRLGKNGGKIIHTIEPNFEIGKAITLTEGKDITLISTGEMLGIIMQARAVLTSKGFSVRVLSMPTVSPLDIEAVFCAAAQTGHLISVEEHGRGGLGTAIAETLVMSQEKFFFEAINTKAPLIHLVGSQQYLQEQNGLSVENVVNKAIKLLKKNEKI